MDPKNKCRVFIDQLRENDAWFKELIQTGFRIIQSYGLYSHINLINGESICLLSNLLVVHIYLMLKTSVNKCINFHFIAFESYLMIGYKYGLYKLELTRL